MEMNQTAIRDVNGTHVTDLSSSDRETSSKPLPPDRSELNYQVKIIDPRLLQRYSIDDNGGGYRGL